MFNFRKKKKEPKVDTETLPDSIAVKEYNIDINLSTPETVGYPSKDIQNDVYAFSSKYIEHRSSILDLGAGYGGYALYLQNLWQLSYQIAPIVIGDFYTGIEYLPLLVNEAANHGIIIENAHWDNGMWPEADWVVNILSLTLPPITLKDVNFDDYVTDHIFEMWETAKKGVSFTFLRPSTRTDLSDYKTIEINSLIKFCEANNFIYIIDCSYNDYVTNLTIFKN